MTIAPTADSGALRTTATAIAAAGKLQPTLRIFALSAALLSFVYIVNAYLLFWQDWPGIAALLGSAGLFGFEAPNKSLGDSLILAWLQAAAYIGTVAIIAFYVLRTRSKTLHTDAQRLSAIGAYIARAAFWSVLLVGLTDAAISFLRVEGVLPDVVGKKLAQDLGRSSFRGQFVHIPLILVGMAISLFPGPSVSPGWHCWLWLLNCRSSFCASSFRMSKPLWRILSASGTLACSCLRAPIPCCTKDMCG